MAPNAPKVYDESRDHVLAPKLEAQGAAVPVGFGASSHRFVPPLRHAERGSGGEVPQRFAPLRAFFPTAAPSRDTTLYAMLARVRSAAVLGIDAYLVEVETDIANGLPTFATVGLPQGAVKEGRERVFAAIANSGYTFPLKRITG